MTATGRSDSHEETNFLDGEGTPSLVKILVVGDAFTGKTTFLRRYVQDRFTANYKATVGIDFHQKVIKYPPGPHTGEKGRTVDVRLWDIQGQESSKLMTRAYYKDAKGAMVMCDVERIRTFDGAKQWKKDIDEKIFITKDQPIPVILVINKTDVPTPCPLSEEELKRFVEEYKFDAYFFSSAKNNVNVDKAVKEIVLRTLKYLPKEDAQVQRPNIVLSDKRRHRSCCR